MAPRQNIHHRSPLRPNLLRSKPLTQEYLYDRLGIIVRLGLYSYTKVALRTNTPNNEDMAVFLAPKSG